LGGEAQTIVYETGIIPCFKDGGKSIVLQHVEYTRRDLDWFLHGLISVLFNPLLI
jgi:hypothetical protein